MQKKKKGGYFQLTNIISQWFLFCLTKDDIQLKKDRTNLFLFAPIYTPISVEINSPSYWTTQISAIWHINNHLLCQGQNEINCMTISSFTEISRLNKLTTVQILHRHHLPNWKLYYSKRIRVVKIISFKSWVRYPQKQMPQSSSGPIKGYK